MLVSDWRTRGVLVVKVLPDVVCWFGVNACAKLSRQPPTCVCARQPRMFLLGVCKQQPQPSKPGQCVDCMSVLCVRFLNHRAVMTKVAAVMEEAESAQVCPPSTSHVLTATYARVGSAGVSIVVDGRHCSCNSPRGSLLRSCWGGSAVPFWDGGARVA